VGVVCTKEAATAGGNAPLTSGKKAETDVFWNYLSTNSYLFLFRYFYL
jgi:hypothetical protein